ncbi:hypothetical protein LENED_006348 [Lentinula edodes]|uniref:Uncharacterized protein n=1 Tax=Lentinula edodes TaxID=5353 RepID=A0A1Q3EBG2_LENED|nr:hypothetical protein LENED_006348 [Lentinula edodes]
MRLSTLGGKVNFKSPSFAKYGYLPEKSTIFKLLENVDEIAKQTELSITGDISYLSASLALLKNKGCLEDPAKTQQDWDKYKEKVEKNRLEQHKQREKEQHEKEQHKEEEQEAKAARQGNMGLNFILHP